MKMASKRQWWRFAKAMQMMPPEERRRVFHGKSSRAHMSRIAALHHTQGEALDDLRAPLRVYKFVAYAPERPGAPSIVGQRVRFEAVMAYFEEHLRWPLPPELPVLAREVDAKLGVAEPLPVSAPRRRSAEEKEADEQATLEAGLAVVTALAEKSPSLAHLLEQMKALSRQ